jgi:tetratricopeptide (TPR) repeat protein
MDWEPSFSSLMKQKVFIAIAAAMISAFASVSSAQPKTSLPTTQQIKPLPALSEEQVKSLIQSETEKKDALRGQAEAERKFNFTMTWVQVLLAGVSALEIIPVLLGLFFLIFRKSILGQLNAEAKEEVAKQVEEHIKPIIDTEVEAQVFDLIERIKKLNQLAQEFEAVVPSSTQVALSPEKLSQIDELRRRIEDLQDLIPTVAPSAKYYFKQGNAFYFENRYEEAIVSYKKALELKPDIPIVWVTYGVALAHLSRYEEAIICYDKAIRLKQDYSDALLVRGIALRNLGRHEEALVSYDKVLELKPDDPITCYNQGNALTDLGRYEEALVSYDKALELKPDDPTVLTIWNLRGSVLSNLGRYEEALVSYDKALELNPKYSLAWYNRACCYAFQEKVEETVHDLKKAIELDLTLLERAKTDSNFDRIRHDERFQKLLNAER